MGSNYSVKDFKQLIVWQKSFYLSKDIYQITKRLQNNDVIKNQVIRSVTSIAANIAEGNAFSGLYPKKELSFIANSIGSANESRHWICLALANSYITQEEYYDLDQKLIEIIKMLNGYIRKLQKDSQSDS